MNASAPPSQSSIVPVWSGAGAGVYLLPMALMLALWLPGCNDGWFRTDSHYYAAVGLNAWRSGDLLNLRLGDVPYHNKPPLALLVHGWFLHVLGVHVWVGRLPSLLAGLGAVWGVVGAVGQLGGRRLALAAGVVLATTVEFTRYTRTISLDLWVAMFLSFALLISTGAWRADRPWRLPWVGLMIGLGLLVKPFVALLALPLLGVWFALVGWPWRRWVWPLALGVLTALCVAVPWHVAMLQRFGNTFWETFVVKQSLNRLVQDSPKPLWYYFQIMAESYWPWLLALLGAALAFGQGRHREDGTLQGAGVRSALMLAGVWCAVWMLAITLTGDKHGRYAVPVYLLLCVLAGWWLTLVVPGPLDRLASGSPRWLPAGVLGVGVVLAGVLGIAGVRVHRERDPAWDQLLVAIDQSPQAKVWTTSQVNSMAANLVLLGRTWPHLVGDGATAGDFVLFSRSENTSVVPGQVVVSGQDFVALRLAQPWPPQGGGPGAGRCRSPALSCRSRSGVCGLLCLGGSFRHLYQEASARRARG
jgi:4-amino-4-deoxy-L-arabinose transferase-like glycosyltransferase